MTKNIILAALVLWSGFAVAQSDTSGYGQLAAQRNQAIAKGDYKTASIYSERQKSLLLKAKYDRHSGLYINTMFDVYSDHFQNGEFDKSLQALLDLSQICEEFGDTQNNYYPVVQGEMAMIYARKGDMNKARQCFVKLFNAFCGAEGIGYDEEGDSWLHAYDCASKFLKKGKDVEVYSYNDFVFANFASLLNNQQLRDQATSILEMALPVYAEAQGKTSPMYINAVSQLWSFYMEQHKYDKALEHQLAALPIYKEVYGDRSPSHLNLLQQIANTYGLLGNLAKKDEYLNMVMGQDTRKTSGKGADLTTLVSQFNAYFAAQNYPKAIEVGVRAIDMAKKQHDNEEYLTMLNNLSAAYIYTNDLQKSLQMLNEALRYLESVHEVDSWRYISVLNNLSYQYYVLKDIDNEEFYKSKLIVSAAMMEKIDLADVDAKNPDLSDALLLSKALIDQADNLKQRTIKDYAPFVAQLYTVAHRKNKAADIEPILQTLVQKTESMFGRNTRECYQLYRTLGLLTFDAKKFSESIDYYKIAEEIVMNIYGENSTECAMVLDLLSESYAGIFNDVRRMECLEKSSVIYRNVFGELSNYYSMSLAKITNAFITYNNYDSSAAYFAKFLDVKKNEIRNNFSFMTAKERDNFYQEGLDKFKSYTFYYLSTVPENQNCMRACYDFELLAKGLMLSSEKEMNLFLSQNKDPRITDLYNKVNENRKLIQSELSKSTSQRMSGINDLVAQTDQMERDLVSSCAEYADMAKNVDITWIDIRDNLGKNDVAIEFIMDDDGHYGALVLTKGMKSPEGVRVFDDKAFMRAVYQASETDSDIKFKPYESTAAYDIIWKPLEKYFKPGCTIYFSPKGILQQMGIENLPIGGDSLFSHKYNVMRVSSTRSVVLRNRNIKVQSACLYGGIQYQNPSINYLPGSKDEADAIKIFLDEKKLKTTYYQGTDADINSFMQLSGKGINLMHIATHGFYQQTNKNTLSNTGLCMHDGILKSDVICGLDLSGTDLVVLSACESGLGKVNGDGVFGLQRAFKVAGAKTLIMSLWPVNDYATKLLMVDFYKNLFELKMPKRDAFNLAINNLRSKKGVTPWHWAAFIMLD